MATKCRKCQSIFFPPKRDCPKCLSSDIEWQEIKENGRLISYTIVHYGPAGFEDKTPYILGVAEFPEKIKVMALLSRYISEDEVKVGMTVKVVSAKLHPDKVSYEFRIAG